MGSRGREGKGEVDGGGLFFSCFLLYDILWNETCTLKMMDFFFFSCTIIFFFYCFFFIIIGVALLCCYSFFPFLKKKRNKKKIFLRTKKKNIKKFKMSERGLIRSLHFHQIQLLA